MSSIAAFIEFINILRDLYQAYLKVKSDDWFKDLMKTKEMINAAITPEEKLLASKALSNLFNSID